ncbi:hypothetical protein R75461_07300 [Paraburkholderia nemoris]|nr:StbB family protein [Paraburkholderia aspalathi]MBK3786048.1 StbB [Paraburkholderia aspalathi]CAE6847180.1 hypothetical protein R75461_07300 [Paraburkholderia nemoris]
MNIAVINFSGNVGKTTVVRHLLAPRLPESEVIAIESINADETAGLSAERMRGQQFGELQERLLSGGAVIVDIGASNVEDFMALMGEFDGSHEDFDQFVVPTVPAGKQQRDTVATISELQAYGVPASRIRVIFNMVDRVEHADMERVFEPIFACHEAHRSFTLSRTAVIHRSEIYSRAAAFGMSIDAILSDPTDYKAEIGQTANQAEKARLARLVSIRRLAGGVSAELDAVFKAITA